MISAVISSKVGVQAIQEMEISNTDYYRMFKSILQNTWYYQAPLRPYNKKLVKPISVNEYEFNEEQSDKCMSDILGSQTYGVPQKCKITDDCWKAVTTKGTGGYFLTHQALYFIIADLVGCRSVISERLKFDLNDLFTDYGSNIFSQMKNNIENTNIDEDLFLEQSIFCNWLGIDSSNQVKWIKKSLEWQDKSGCVRPQYDIDTIAPTKYISSARKLKYDVVLENGCSSHTTGLYIMYLAMSLHWLLTHSDTHLDNTFWRFQEKAWLVFVLFIFIVLILRYHFFRNRILTSIRTML